jgi:hypothetical protein
VRSIASRLGPVISKAISWLLIIAWLALLGWWIYTLYISEIITWVILTLIGCRLRSLARRLWWRCGWHWPLPPAPPPSPPPPFRICCGRDYRGWVSAPRQIAVLVLGPPRSGKTRGLIIPNVVAWEGRPVASSAAVARPASAGRRPDVCRSGQASRPASRSPRATRRWRLRSGVSRISAARGARTKTWSGCAEVLRTPRGSMRWLSLASTTSRRRSLPLASKGRQGPGSGRRICGAVVEQRVATPGTLCLVNPSHLRSPGTP